MQKDVGLNPGSAAMVHCVLFLPRLVEDEGKVTKMVHGILDRKCNATGSKEREGKRRMLKQSNFWCYVSNHILLNCYSVSLAVLFCVMCVRSSRGAFDSNSRHTAPPINVFDVDIDILH